VFDGTGWWVIFPIIGLAFMLLMMSRMFFSRRGGSGGGSGVGPMRMGPMGMMSHDREQDHGDEGTLDELRSRYAAGELTDEEFDAKRRRLEGR
jgi:uncharacterized membrane protein